MFRDKGNDDTAEGYQGDSLVVGVHYPRRAFPGGDATYEDDSAYDGDDDDDAPA